MNNEINQYLEECDLCHDYFGITELILTENGQLLCKTCIAVPSERNEVS